MGPRLDEFEVLSTVGSGAHGTVRKVKRCQDGQILVWKELNYGAMSESEKQSLVLEVNLLRELRHPNIVKFLHHIVERRSTTLYILMEYCPGGDLKCLISKCRHTSTFLEEGFIWRVLKQICEALKVCHTRQLRGGRVILHRDIKPANVFLDADGEVKLGDFGLARTLNSEASFATTFVGTPYYMSPEVIEGQEYNEKSDIWSLGCLIYELCALHPPFQATTHKQLAAKIRETRYERIPIQYSNELHDVLGLMLTYEDFLRPTALMVLHHSALIAHTTSDKDQEDDPLYQSLNPSVLLGAGNPLRKSDNVGDVDGLKENDNFEAKENKKVEIDKEERWEKANEISRDTILTKPSEVSASNVRFTIAEKDKTCIKKSKQNSDDNLCPSSETCTDLEKYLHSCDDADEQFLFCQDKLVRSQSEIQVSSSSDNLPQENKFKVPHLKKQGVGLEDTTDVLCRVARGVGSLLEDTNKVLEGTSESTLAHVECAPGGVSKAWRKRVIALREAEIAVREREVAVKEREREVSHREHRVTAMEREARQHLVRAQIYLRQSRSRQNAATSPHRPPSDLDTTVSADPGDEEVATTMKLDPQLIDNPFLKMRGVQPLPEKRVSFKEKPTKFKSNTLDNPKSRRKRGNIFSLVERATETRKETNDKVSEEIHSRAPFKALSGNTITSQLQSQKSNLMPDKKSQEPSPPLEAFHPSQKKSAREPVCNQNQNSMHIVQDRQRSTENLYKKSLDTWSDKENIAQAVKQKKVPELKPGLWNKPGSKGAERTGRRENPTLRSKNHVLQFYNVV